MDDEDEIRSLLKEFFTRQGCDVETAANGTACLAAIDQIPDISLVLLDIRLPDIGGIDLLRQIKTTKPKIGVIMLTAVQDREIAKQATVLGAFDYVLKPINLAELDVLVRVCLGAMLYRHGDGGMESDERSQLDAELRVAIDEVTQAVLDVLSDKEIIELITVVRGYSQLMLEDPDNPKYAGRLRRALAMLADMLRAHGKTVLAKRVQAILRQLR